MPFQIQEIQKCFILQGNEISKQNYEKYFKQVVKFYGLKSPDVKKIFSQWYPVLKKLELQEKISIGFQFLQSQYQEDKAFGILLFAKVVQQLDLQFLKSLQESFKILIYDWASCDTLSSRVICPLIQQNQTYLQFVQSWKNNSYLWLQRAACVSFVKIARTGKYNEVILDICNSTIRNGERFVQLGTGWVLRELSTANLQIVIDFIQANYQYFSREGLRYAIEKMDENNKYRLRSMTNH